MYIFFDMLAVPVRHPHTAAYCAVNQRPPCRAGTHFPWGQQYNLHIFLGSTNYVLKDFRYMCVII